MKKPLTNKWKKGADVLSLMVTTADMAKDTIANIKKNNYARYTIAGAAIIDCDMREQGNRRRGGCCRRRKYTDVCVSGMDR